MSKVYVGGVGMVPIGDHWTKSITDLAADAALKTIKAANLQNPEIRFMVYLSWTLPSNPIGVSSIFGFSGPDRATSFSSIPSPGPSGTIRYPSTSCKGVINRSLFGGSDSPVYS